MPKFSVTYEIITQESAEHGDTAEDGFISKDVSLRHAIADLDGCGHVEASQSLPFDSSSYGVWFTSYGEMNLRDGSYENRSLHPPRGTTPASMRRIARLLGAR